MALLLAVSACGGTDSASDASKKSSPHPVTDVDGNTCSSDATKYGLCRTNRYYGDTPSEARAARRAAAVAARAKARRAAAAARRRARARAAAARRRAAAHAAYLRAANAWHASYTRQDDNVYWKWDDNGDCKEYAVNGCWHVVVITRLGCPSYVAVNANEYQNGSIVNQLLDNQGYGIPPKTPRVFELDSDSSSGDNTAGDVTIDCS
jgi:hypothetical protein